MAGKEIIMEELSEAGESSNPDRRLESVLKNLVDNRSGNENKIQEIVSSNKKEFKRFLNRWITSKLRNDDCQAYVCNTEWETISDEGETGTCTYDFIEIEDDEEIVLVDIAFRSHFNISKASELYKSVQRYLPSIFVGNNEKLTKIVRLISSVAEESMAAEDIPPYIRGDEMLSRWLAANIVTRK